MEVNFNEDGRYTGRGREGVGKVWGRELIGAMSFTNK